MLASMYRIGVDVLTIYCIPFHIICIISGYFRIELLCTLHAKCNGERRDFKLLLILRLLPAVCLPPPPLKTLENACSKVDLTYGHSGKV